MFRDFIFNFFSPSNLANILLGAALMAGAGWIFWQVCWPNLKQPATWLVVMACLILVAVGLNLILMFNTTERPRFSGTIDRIYMMPATAVHPPLGTANDTVLFLIVSIRNNGSPSIAEIGSLQIIPADGGPSPITEGKFLPAATTIGLVDATGRQPPIWLKGSDALYNKTVAQPVPTGALVRGILQYVVHDATYAQLSIPGTVYRLTYTDNQGGQHTTELKWSLQPVPSGYLPGLTEVAPPSGFTLPTTSPSPAASSSPAATPTSAPETKGPHV